MANDSDTKIVEAAGEPQSGPEQENKKPGAALASLGILVWDLAKILILSLIIIIPIRFLVFQPFIVSGSSMEPNFHHGDYLVIDEISYRFREPSRGDVVVLRPPDQPNDFFIKRIIGLPEEKIVFTNGKVKVYAPNDTEGTVLPEDYLRAGTRTNVLRDQTVKLGSGQYYLLGDNRQASSDSRVWGPLPRQEIVGKVWLKVFPISQLSFFKTPSYASP